MVDLMVQHGGHPGDALRHVLRCDLLRVNCSEEEWLDGGERLASLREQWVLRPIGRFPRFEDLCTTPHGPWVGLG